MGKLVDGLLAYLASASSEQLEKDWEDLKEFNEIGPEVNSFISQSRELNKRIKIDDLIANIHFIDNIENPDFNLDFFNCNLFVNLAQ